MAVAAGGALRVVNPATLEVVGTVPVTDAAGVQELVTEARLAQERFAEATLVDRRRLVSARVLERLDAIADTVVAETGKPRIEAFTTELFTALDALAWLDRNL